MSETKKIQTRVQNVTVKNMKICRTEFYVNEIKERFYTTLIHWEKMKN